MTEKEKGLKSPDLPSLKITIFRRLFTSSRRIAIPSGIDLAFGREWLLFIL
jgi:hypothetical protein